MAANFVQQIVQILTDCDNFCTTSTRNEFFLHIKVSKCLTSRCMCKHAISQNQRTRLFHISAEFFSIKALKYRHKILTRSLQTQMMFKISAFSVNQAQSTMPKIYGIIHRLELFFNRFSLSSANTDGSMTSLVGQC